MEALKKYWGLLATGLVGFVGLLLYMLSGKKKEVAALNAQIDLVKTEKQADVIEGQIQTLKADQATKAAHAAELDKSLQVLQDKRAQNAEDAKKLTDPKAIADYWNHQ